MHRKVQILWGNKLNTGLVLLYVNIFYFPSLLTTLSYTAPISSNRSSRVPFSSSLQKKHLDSSLVGVFYSCKFELVLHLILSN